MIDSYLEQKVNSQHVVKLEKYAIESFDLLRIFCQEMSIAKHFDRYNKFRGNRKDKRDDW